MVGRVVLVCHGSTAATRGTAFPLDEGLEPIGRAAAEAIAGRFMTADGERSRTGERSGDGERSDARSDVRCGPARRCRETADALGLTAVVDDGLADWDLGHWAGRTLTELAEQHPDQVAAWTTDPDFDGHGGETLTQVIARVGRWLDQPVATPRTGRLIAVTHPAVIRSAVVHALQAPAASFWRIDVAPLAVVELRGGAGRWALYPGPAVPR